MIIDKAIFWKMKSLAWQCKTNAHVISKGPGASFYNYWFTELVNIQKACDPLNRSSCMSPA